MPVLDSSAILNAFGFSFDQTFTTTPHVLKELKDLRSRSLAESAVSDGKLVLKYPSEAAINEVRKNVSGEKLSQTDIRVLALAFELKEEIWTDDYSIQNVAQRMGVQFKAVMHAGIKKQKRFKKQCPNCKRFYSLSTSECEYCSMHLETI